MQTKNPEINILRSAIVEHPLVPKLDSLPSWRVFMEYHVFAVWDFMALLKRLQREFAPQTVPWRPPASPNLARFINEIVLVEESDGFRGEYLSHCEIYVRAMKQCGADIRPFQAFLHALTMEHDVAYALRIARVPEAVRAFVEFTLDVAENGTAAEVCAVFLWGREDLIPDMFVPLVALCEGQNDDTAYLRHYLQRHIDIDGDEHGPLAARMMDHVCEREKRDRSSLDGIVTQALSARLMLWSAIEAAVTASGDRIGTPSRHGRLGA